MTTQEQRAAWRELEQAATPGEWVVETIPNRIVSTDEKVAQNGWEEIGTYNADADAAFIAAARAAVPALLDDVDALTAKQAEMEAALLRLSPSVVAILNAKVDKLTAERDALARMLDAEMLRRQDAESDILRLTEDDTESAFERTATLRAERDALAAELAGYKRHAAYVAGVIDAEGKYVP